MLHSPGPQHAVLPPPKKVTSSLRQFPLKHTGLAAARPPSQTQRNLRRCGLESDNSTFQNPKLWGPGFFRDIDIHSFSQYKLIECLGLGPVNINHLAAQGHSSRAEGSLLPRPEVHLITRPIRTRKFVVLWITVVWLGQSQGNGGHR